LTMSRTRSEIDSTVTEKNKVDQCNDRKCISSVAIIACFFAVL
jgi:hypothetical protein